MIKKLLKKLKQRVEVTVGKITSIKAEVDCKHVWYGNSYGGFYVYPDILNSESIIYSFGIGEDITFDKAIIEKHKCQVFGFDPTPKSINWIKNQQLPPGFIFMDYGIELETGSTNFFLPKNKDYVSGSAMGHNNVDLNDTVSVPMKKFEDITKEFGHNHISLLKMDIEGSEYKIIEDILASSIQIDQILIELHERFFVDGKSRTKSLLKSFKEKGYAVFAVSESFEEISFIKLNLISKV